MVNFIDLVISGAVSGAIYSLIAAGLVLTYTSTGVFNLSYAAVAFVSAYLFFEFVGGLGWPVWAAAVLIILVIAPLIGLLFERVIFRALASANDAAKITATIGLLIALPAIVQYIISGGINTFHWNIPSGADVFLAPGLGPSPKVTWHLPGGFALNSDQLIVFVTAGLCAVGLWWLMKHTALGLRMRAVVDAPRQAQLAGVNVQQVPTFAWVIGTVFAALAGVVGAPIFNSLDPGTYTTVAFVATAAVVIGRFRSIPLAFAGGLIVGILQNLVAGYASFANSIPGFPDAVPFIVLLIGLIVLGRQQGRRAGSIQQGAEATVHEDATAMWRRWTPRRLLVTAVLLAVYFVYLYVFADKFWLIANVTGLGLALAFLSFVVITGMGGMLNLAPAAFVMTAALTCGLAIDRYHVPWFFAAVLAVVVAMVVGLIVALPAARLGGLALALATLALAFVADSILFNWSFLVNGINGWTFRRPRLGSLGVDSDRVFAAVLIALIIGAVVLIINIHRSPSGRAMFAVRNSEPGAATSGVSPVRIKLLVFALGAGLAGIGGVVLVTYTGSVNSTTYPAGVGLTWFAAVVLWGVRRPGAAIAAGMSSALFATLLGAGFNFGFLSWSGTTSPYIPSILFGLGAVQMAKEPDGIFRMVEKQRDARRIGRQNRALARLAGAGAVAPALAGAVPSTAGVGPSALLFPAANGQELASSLPGSGDGLVSPNGHGQHAVPGARASVQSLATASSAGERPALEIRGICAGYGELKVLFDVDLVVPKGSITALVGANGAGKSTLCGVIAGLVRASSGSTVLDGVDITAEPVHRRARRGLVLTPESRGIFPGLTVEENLAVRGDSSMRMATYERFPLLATRRNIPAGSLSGGEQQILSLGPVLAQNPTLLVADEPTLGLAPLMVQTILGLIESARAEGTSVLLVEEKAHSILGIADYVVFFELGRVVWAGPVAEVDNEELLASYFGTDTGQTRPAPAR